jgi:hypothetical protein
MDRAKLHLIVRTLIALAGGATATGMHAAGYQGGAETTVGVDGGTIRDAVGLGIGAVSIFYPQILGLWASITSNPRLDALEKRVDKLEGKPAEPSAAGPVITQVTKAKATEPD